MIKQDTKDQIALTQILLSLEFKDIGKDKVLNGSSSIEGWEGPTTYIKVQPTIPQLDEKKSIHHKRYMDIEDDERGCDILVRIDKVIFPADFLILDCEADENAPIILGSPFPATGRVLLDFGNDELMLGTDTNTTGAQTNPEIGNWVQLRQGNPTICMHKILLEENHKPTVDAQRRLNQAMKDVVRKEILNLLDAGIIYPISDSEWVSPVQYVPKKGGITVISNENNELIPTRTVTGWWACMDYQKLNKATRKDHFFYHLLIKCLTDWQENHSIASLMAIQVPT
ncbi:hypothetical protein GQ457_05G023600 [Hibiscus cannabinus]